jgi:hypothetical protein
LSPPPVASNAEIVVDTKEAMVIINIFNCDAKGAVAQLSDGPHRRRRSSGWARSRRLGPARAAKRAPFPAYPLGHPTEL